MKTRQGRFFAPIVLLAVLCSTTAVATDVYRWTDDSGLVHYGQRPPADGARRIDIDDARQQVPPASATDEQRRERQRRLLESYEYQREQKKQRAEEAAADKERMRRRCVSLQRRWRSLSNAGPVYRTREDGTRDYLSDAQRTAEKQAMQKAYRQACGHDPG